MSASLIVSKAKEDPKFKEFLFSLIKKDQVTGGRTQYNLEEVREYVSKELGSSVVDNDITEAIAEILRTEDVEKSLDHLNGSQVDTLVESERGISEKFSRLLVKDLENENKRAQDLKKELEDTLKDELKDIKRVYDRVINMYTIAFIIGVILIGVAVISAFLPPPYQNFNLTALFAGLGAADIVSSLIFRPAKDLQSGIISSVQLIATFLTWISDFQSLNNYLKYSPDKSLNAYKNISELKINNLRNIVSMINTFRHWNLDATPEKARDRTDIESSSTQVKSDLEHGNM
jgi:hypothetical protein